MDRKFIANNCKKCLRCLDVFGLWCAENMTPDGKGLVMCTALEECPYQKKYPACFERQWHLKQSARTKDVSVVCKNHDIDVDAELQKIELQE